MTTTEIILAAQALASSAMCGLIWFVQMVHYPLFARTDTTHSPDYPDENQRRTGPVVIPPMLVEAATATLIAISPPPAIGRPAALAGLAMVAACLHRPRRRLLPQRHKQLTTVWRLSAVGMWKPTSAKHCVVSV